MKKFGKFLAAIALSAAMCFSAVGCNLVVTDTDLDMEQVVATVQIEEGAPVENILKRDLVLMYLNYGYSYVQQGQYTQKEVMEMLMDQLVNNAIMVQNAVKAKAESVGVTEDKYDIEKNIDKYLTSEEKAEALYNTNKSINDLIDGYKEAEEEEEKETSSETVRTAPTGAAVYEEEHKGFDTWEEFYNDYNAKGYVVKDDAGDPIGSGVETGFRVDAGEYKITDIETKKAYNKVIKALEQNGLIGEDFDYNTDSIYHTDYYKDALKSQRENIILSWYEQQLTVEILKTVSYRDLADRYAEMYKAQQGYTAAEYETALSGWSSSSPVVYNAYDGYGFVYNLLLGVNAAQSAEITALKEESNLSTAEYRAKRAEIISRVEAKDLRSSWITAGYDFDFESKKFTHDYSLASSEYALPFKGEVEWLNRADKPENDADDEDYEPEYKINNVDKYDLKSFIDLIDSTLLSGVTAEEVSGTPYYRVNKTAAATEIAEYEERVNDLLFAFSTDPGSLNTYKGYLVKPVPESGETETYVQEFADAARELLKGEYGAGSYIVVGTDFGYHILFKSVTLKAGEGYDTLDKYLDSLGYEKKIGDTVYESWELYYNAMIADLESYLDDNDENENFYLYQLQQAYVSNILTTELQAKQTLLVNACKTPDEDGNYTEYNEKYVTIFEDRYSELMGE
ncbi:MAG: hypothetical protein DBX59_11495 [Bacillota bacterium]|nr:MAG: hypothetical protein DBX59_11495 [Bacillota bacterium]